MRHEDLIELLKQAFERAAARLHAQGHDEPWPDDLWPQEIVRLLRDRSRVVIAALEEEVDISF